MAVKRNGRNTLVSPLRQEAERAFAGVRRDRRDALYIAREQLDASGWFFVEPMQGALSLSPTADGIGALVQWLEANLREAQTAPKTQPWLRFRGRPSEEADICVLCAGLKLLESGAGMESVAAWRALLTGRAARLLRWRQPYGGCLYACALALALWEQGT